MKRMTSKLTAGFVVLLLLAAAATTAISQEAPKAIDLNALAARGEALANADPLSAELRNRQPDDQARRGFDIGMAAAEGQTLPGPGKQKIGASLPPAEQRGFNIAVSFSLERNRNAKLAAIGAAIAKVDEKVAAARTLESDVFYWLGFDIATGIFGDPALGAQGNTATGPRSLKIRDSLSPAGQSGFNASVKFHTGQDAPPSPSPERRPRTPGEVTSIDNLGKSDKVYVTPGVVTSIDNLGKSDKVYVAEPSTEIRCRGGAFPAGGFAGDIPLEFITVGSRLTSTGETINIIHLSSFASPYAAGARSEGLWPGECSWVDRPPDIPDYRFFGLGFETPANAQLRQQLHGTPVDTSPTAAERFPDAQSIPAYMNDPNHYWSFFGVRQVNNSYTATGNKYWKPPLEVFGPNDPLRRKGSSPSVLVVPKKPE
jgi:hypothetical protein